MTDALSSRLFDPALLTHIRTGEDVTATVRLPVAALVAGRLPSLSVGAVRELAPVLSLAAVAEVRDVDEYFSDCDPVGDWWCDPTGACCARACLLEPDTCGLGTFVLDIAGRAVPVDGETRQLPGLNVIEVRGTLHLDPRFDRDGPLASTGAWCREEWRVAALRRYAANDGEPGGPTDLERLPDPWDVQDTALYVADLVGHA